MERRSLTHTHTDFVHLIMKKKSKDFYHKWNFFQLKGGWAYMHRILTLNAAFERIVNQKKREEIVSSLVVSILYSPNNFSFLLCLCVCICQQQQRTNKRMMTTKINWEDAKKEGSQYCRHFPALICLQTIYHSMINRKKKNSFQIATNREWKCIHKKIRQGIHK